MIIADAFQAENGITFFLLRWMGQ